MKRLLKKYLKQTRNYFRGIFFSGTERFCFICNKSYSKFLDRKGDFPRENAVCPGCNSMERHRIAWYFLTRKTNLFDGTEKSVLHIAPEEFFESRLRKEIGKGYITGDLFEPGVDVKMDITDIHYENEHFDVIYCAHVLEHVRDDKKALKELYRVLKKDGWAIIIVPLEGEKTIEAPGVTDPEELFKLFGQSDHVRQYGYDFIERIVEAGFSVEVTKPEDLFGEEELIKFGMLAFTDDIYFCTKN